MTIEMSHPDGTHPIVVTEQAFDQIWAHRGWVRADQAKAAGKGKKTPSKAATATKEKRK